MDLYCPGSRDVVDVGRDETFVEDVCSFVSFYESAAHASVTEGALAYSARFVPLQ